MINLELEDLTDTFVKYSFFYNKEEKGYIIVNLKTLEKQVDNTINVVDNVIDDIYNKICWYKYIDNFFEKGFA